MTLSPNASRAAWNIYAAARNRYAREWAEGHTMSTTPGLHRVERNVPKVYSLATKVTGRNLAAVSYLVSLFGEAAGIPSSVTATFATDGSLQQVEVTNHDTQRASLVEPGEYIILSDKPAEIFAISEETYRENWVPVD